MLYYINLIILCVIKDQYDNEGMNVPVGCTVYNKN